jgi:hypothetical protein
MGAIKTFYTALSSAPSLAGISIGFGEESVAMFANSAPAVVIVPKGGPWDVAPYAHNVDPDVNRIWMTNEQIDIYIAGFSSATNAAGVDHADATEDLLGAVLQALQWQQAQGSYASPVDGARYIPVSGAWMLAGNEMERFGRCYVLSIQVDKTFADVLPIDAPIPITTTLNLVTSHG